VYPPSAARRIRSTIIPASNPVVITSQWRGSTSFWMGVNSRYNRSRSSSALHRAHTRAKVQVADNAHLWVQMRPSFRVARALYSFIPRYSHGDLPRPLQRLFFTALTHRLPLIAVALMISPSSFMKVHDAISPWR